MNIFEFDDYKFFVKDFVGTLPKKGRGELQKMATKMRVHPTMVSQVLNGDKHLTLEQACQLTEHFGLSDAESDYFLNLVEIQRAGSHKLKNRLKSRINKLKQQNLQVKNRLPQKRKKMSQSEQAIFYSDWYYSAIRLLTSIERYNTIDTIAERLGLSRADVARVVNFLHECGLCHKEAEELRMGSKRTHVPADSPFSKSHHRNWRMRGMELVGEGNDDDIFFTAPMTISRKDAPLIKKKILSLIEQVAKDVDKSSPEELYCMNIDFFNL